MINVPGDTDDNMINIHGNFMMNFSNMINIHGNIMMNLQGDIENRNLVILKCMINLKALHIRIIVRDQYIMNI
jgi:hypothetical protein